MLKKTSGELRARICWNFRDHSAPHTPHLTVSWDTVTELPELLVPRAESLPPTCSTIGLRQVSLCLLPPAASSSSSQMICLLISRHRDNFPLLAVSTSLKMASTLSLGRSGRASSYSWRVVGRRETGCKYEMIVLDW